MRIHSDWKYMEFSLELLLDNKELIPLVVSDPKFSKNLECLLEEEKGYGILNATI